MTLISGRSNNENTQHLASKTVRVVFLSLLIDILAFTIILPLFPRLLQDYQNREQGDEVSAFLFAIYLPLFLLF